MPQREMAGWLRYFDSFYEICSSQTMYSDDELIKPWMAHYPLISSAAFTWFDHIVEKKRAERAKDVDVDVDDPDAAQPPSMKGHVVQMKSAHPMRNVNR